MSSNTTMTVGVAHLEALAEQVPADGTIAVHDSAGAISADLALRGSSAILAFLPRITDILVTDGGSISLTAAQALTGGVDDDAHSALALARGGGFTITGASVAQLSQLGRLPVVPDHIGVADGAAAVLAHLETVRRLRHRLRLTITDTWLEAAHLPALASLGGMLGNGVPVRDTGLAIATLADSEDAASIGYMNAHGAVLRADSIVSVADVVALSRLTGFRKDGHALMVWDSAANLIAGDAAALSGGLVDSVFLRTPDGTVTLTAAGAVALFTIAGFCAANPDGSVNQVTVADSAAELDAVRRQLAALGSDIGRLVVNSSGTIGAATLRHLQALGATASVGVMLTVRDSAGAIAASFTAHRHGLDAAVWRLSSSAIVTVPEALALARRPQFSPAPYTLTLGSDAVVSAAEARTLATLGDGLSCGGHTVTLRDSAANLVAMADSGAWDIATTLTLAGPETVSAAAAERLLGTAKFVLTSTVHIADSAENLVRPSLQALIDASPYAADIHTHLAGANKPDLDISAALASLADFASLVHDTRMAPAERPSVILGAPPAMSGATPPAERPGAWVQSALTPAFDAPAPAIASRAIADVSAHVATGDAAIPAHADRQGGGAPVSAWQPTGAAAPARAAAGDGADIAAGAAASAAATLVNVYGESGLLLSATVEQREGFTVTAPPSGNGRAFSITESIDGRESAPVVVLDAGTLQNAVSAAHAQFAADGAIEVRDGQYLDLYTAGNVPVLDRPALVYDPSAHTVALDIPGQAPLPLIVLGASAPPETLDVSEILVRQAS